MCTGMWTLYKTLPVCSVKMYTRFLFLPYAILHLITSCCRIFITPVHNQFPSSVLSACSSPTPQCAEPQSFPAAASAKPGLQAEEEPVSEKKLPTISQDFEYQSSGFTLQVFKLVLITRNNSEIVGFWTNK